MKSLAVRNFSLEVSSALRVREVYIRDRIVPLLEQNAVGAVKLDFLLRFVVSCNSAEAILHKNLDWPSLFDLLRGTARSSDTRDNRYKTKWINEQFSKLEAAHLVRREQIGGMRRPKVTVLRDNDPSQILDSPDGTPGNSYVTLSGFIVSSGHLGTWGAPEISAYVAAMIAERYTRADPLLTSEFGLERKPFGDGAWFNSLAWFEDRASHRLPVHIRTPFSERTLRRGMKSLETQGLISRQPLYLDPRTKEPFKNGRKFLYQNNFTRLRTPTGTLAGGSAVHA